MNNFHQQLKRILLIDCGDVTFSIFFKAYNIYLSKTHNHEEPEDIEGEIDLSKDEIFFDIMRRQFITNTKRLKYKYNVHFQHIFFIKDSPTEINWRRNIYKEYKMNRKNTKYKSRSFQLGNLFKRIYREIFPMLEEKFKINIIQIHHAEADDTISVIAKSLPNDVTIYIISSDTDYLQLLTRERIYIYTLSGKLVNDKLDGKTAQEKLLYKVMYGDKTDNIPPCLPNTKLIKYYLENPSYLLKELRDNKEIFDKFNRNRVLIDFTFIPESIKNNILEAYYKCVV